MRRSRAPRSTGPIRRSRPNRSSHARPDAAAEELAKPRPIATTPGSNSFAVSGALAGGAALVANDMHLDLRVPGLWFRTRADLSESAPRGTHGRRRSARALPGTPAIVARQQRPRRVGLHEQLRRHADWVRVAARRAHRRSLPHGATAKPIVRHTEIIRVHGARRRNARRRRHRMGPDHRARMPTARRSRSHGPRSSPAHSISSCSASSSPRPPTKPSRSRRSPACRRRTSSSAIAAGNIAWTIAGRLPKRIGDYDASLPADFSQPAPAGMAGSSRDDVPADRQSAVAATVDRESARRPKIRGSRCSAMAATTSARARCQIRDDLRAHASTSRRRHAGDPARRSRGVPRTLEGSAGARAQSRADVGRATRRSKSARDWNGRASIDSVAYRVVERVAQRSQSTRCSMDSPAKVREKFPDFALPRAAASRARGVAARARRSPRICCRRATPTGMRC